MPQLARAGRPLEEVRTSTCGLLRETLGAFRAHATIPSEGAALPEGLPGAGWSDHWAFWQHGYPALMVTGAKWAVRRRASGVAAALHFDALIAFTARAVGAVVIRPSPHGTLVTKDERGARPPLSDSRTCSSRTSRRPLRR
jgi:hypothetical protein